MEITAMGMVWGGRNKSGKKNDLEKKKNTKSMKGRRKNNWK